MFERFTDRARRVVVLAQEEARTLNHNYIGAEHLVLGILREGESIAAKALISLGIDLDYVEQRMAEIIGRGQQPPSGHIPFTPNAKKSLEQSLRQAVQLGHNYIGPEHVLLGLMSQADDGTVAGQILLTSGVDQTSIRDQVILRLFGYEGPQGKPFTDLTARAGRPGGVGSVVGRQQEIADILSVLQREPVTSALLLGERGVGTSTVVAGVAQAIVRQAPPRLAGKRIYELNVPPPPGSSSSDQVAREMVPALLRDISEMRDTILFIERACTSIPVTDGPTTALSLLRPMIVHGDLQAIVPVTPDEQRVHLADDVELAGVFESVFIDELSEELAAVALAELRDRYESRHHVAISDAAITAAVVLSMEHVPDQSLPTKAISLMDKAAALAARRIVPDEMFSETRQRIAGLQASKDAAIDDHDFERAAALRDEEKRQLKALSDQQAAWLTEWKNVPSYRIISVTAEDVAEAVSESRMPRERTEPDPTPAVWATALDLTAGTVTDALIEPMEAFRRLSSNPRRRRSV